MKDSTSKVETSFSTKGLNSTSIERKHFTRDQWLFLVFFVSSDFMAEGISSIQGPLLPAEAEEKGLSPSVYGTIFGMTGVTMTIGSLLGIYVDKIGPRKIYMAAIFLDGLCPICFGFLHFVDSYILFICLALLVRALEGLAVVGIDYSTYAMRLNIFSEKQGAAIGIAESGALMGALFGPLVGTAIFSRFGFTLTYVSFGVTQILIGIITFFNLPDVPKHEPVDMHWKDLLQAYKQILTVPNVTLFVVAYFLGVMGSDFVLTILEPGLRIQHLSAVGIGLMFFCLGALNILAPLWGWVLDKFKRAEHMLATSFIIVCISLSILGPLPFVPMIRTYPSVICALLLFGMGQGMLRVSSVVNVQLEVEEKHVDQSESINRTFIPIVYVGVSGLGTMFGSSSAGILFEHFGFPNALLFLFGTHSTMACLIFAYMASRKCRPRSRVEIQCKESLPLLSLN